MMTKNFHAMLVLVAVLFVGAVQFCSGGNTSFSCIKREREALLKFKLCFNDSSYMLSSWKGNDCCEWKGVGCDKNSRHVVSLQLRGSIFDNLGRLYLIDSVEEVGRLYLIDNVEDVVSSLLKLRYLTHLDLSGNDFNRSLIPPSFGLMTQLRYLNLSKVQFRGRIPGELRNLTRLRVLDLSINYLKVGDGIQWISRLSSLQHLDISEVNLSHASSNLFQVLGMLPSLSWLSLSGCSLKHSHLPSHSHPLNFTFLGNIRYFDLSWNSFDGSIPIFLQNMTSLTFLDMSGVNLSLTSSNLFQVLGMLPSLSWLSLSGCSLKHSHLPSHSHPLNFTFLGNIRYFDLSWNSFDGSIPIFLQNMTSLTFLDMSGVNLSLTSSNLFQVLGMLPSLSWLYLSSCSLENSHLPACNHPCNLTLLNNIQLFDLSWNSFQGPISIFLQNMTSLTFLDLSKLEGLYLSYNQLSGSIPDSIGQLSKLEALYLSGNQLSGSIPDSIGRLSKLKSIDLSGNQLSGSIPNSIGQLSKLEVLHLCGNQLSGSIPDSIGRLSKLESLYLCDNQLSRSIPDSIGRLSKLEDLYLYGNQLSGSIPDSIGRLSKLKRINLFGNQLSGSIPDSIGQLSKLKSIDLSGNQLNGSIPDSIGQLSNLEYLSFSSNKLNGRIPNTIANLLKLIELDFGSNNLNCKMKSNWRPSFNLGYISMKSCKFGTAFPEWLQLQKTATTVDLSNASISGPLLENIGHMMPNLEYLILMDNLINGSIPKSLCNVKYLRYIDLSNNMLSGSIPDCWRSDHAFYFINLSSNNLSGLFPRTIGRLSSLLALHLSNNSLYGELHVALKNLTSLVILDLGENKFSGNLTWIVEDEIGNRSLKVLRLRKNLFSGYIPLELCSFSQLQILDLADNYLIGRIPTCFGTFPMMVNATELFRNMYNIYWRWAHLVEVVKGRYLEYTKKTLGLQSSLDLSSNNLVGSIPEELIFLKELHNLNLSWNNLSGKIPENIGQMENLESLDFSQNDLSGMIPNSMSSLTKLSHLNLSYNNLSGSIPKGNQLQTLEDPSIYAGNPQLCGAPLLKKCSDDALPPTTTCSMDNKEDAVEKMWFYIVVMLGFATGFWGVVGTLIFMKCWRYAYFQWVDDVKDWIFVVTKLKVAQFKKIFNENPDDQ